MKLISALAFLAFAALAFIAPASVSANPIVKVENGYVDWCQGFTDEKAEAYCIYGDFAFDWEGNLLAEPDGGGQNDDNDS